MHANEFGKEPRFLPPLKQEAEETKICQLRISNRRRMAPSLSRHLETIRGDTVGAETNGGGPALFRVSVLRVSVGTCQYLGIFLR